MRKVQFSASDLSKFVGGYFRHLFGDSPNWQANARVVLFDVGNFARIHAACREARPGVMGIWMEGSCRSCRSVCSGARQLCFVFTSAAQSFCAEMSLNSAWLKYTFTRARSRCKFEDFEGHPLPRVPQRVKVNLRDHDLDMFNHGPDYPSTLLYHKSRFINEKILHYAEQLASEETLVCMTSTVMALLKKTFTER